MHSVNVSERMRRLCLGFGMSVRTLATQTGFSPSLIAQVEHGQVVPSIRRAPAVPGHQSQSRPSLPWRRPAR
jgi:predicted transcriptional regulator